MTVREVNHTTFLLSSTLMCKITQAIKMSTDKKITGKFSYYGVNSSNWCLKTTLIKENKRQANIPPSLSEHTLIWCLSGKILFWKQLLTYSSDNIHWSILIIDTCILKLIISVSFIIVMWHRISAFGFQISIGEFRWKLWFPFISP